LSNETQPLLVQVSDEYAEVLDSFASATDQTPTEAMELLVKDSLEEALRDPSFLLDLLEDCQVLMGKKEPLVLH
jgi:exonuclease VII large subunit